MTFLQSSIKALPIFQSHTNIRNNHHNHNINPTNNHHVHCETGGKDPPHAPYLMMWIKGWSAAHDVPSLRRGYEVYRQVCATCHSMKWVKYRMMVNQVFPEQRVKQFAASVDVTDGPNDEGEMFTRPGILTDTFPNPYPNAEAAAYSNGGAAPPDLSIFAATHPDGPEYIFGILNGYRDPPFGIHLRAGLYYNTYFMGGALSMPPPLTEAGQVEYEDGTPSTVTQMSWDVTQFLVWCCDPNHDSRKLMAQKMWTGCFIGCCCSTYWTRVMWSSLRTRRVDFTRVYM